MIKRYTYYWHDYMNCQVIVDNQTTEEYPIEDNRVKDSKYDNNGIEYLVDLLNKQDKHISRNETLLDIAYEKITKLKSENRGIIPLLFKRIQELEDFITVHCEGEVAKEILE